MAGSPGDSVYTQAQLSSMEASYEIDYFTSHSLMGMIEDNGLIEKRAGDRLTVDYNTNPATAYSYGRDATVQATQKGEMIRAYFDWGAIAMDTKEYGWDIENQGSVGSLSTGTLRKLMDQRIKILENSMSEVLPTRLWQGAGAALNAGSGVEFTGVEQQVPTSPGSATVGGLSWATYTNLQSQQIAGTSGPSSNWQADAWERLLTLRVACRQPRSKGKDNKSGWIAYCTAGDYVDVVNLAYNQNTSVGASVQDIKMVGGIMPEINDIQDANTLYLIKPNCWKLFIPPMRRRFVELDVRDSLDDRMNRKDTVAILTAKGCLVNMFPPHNGVITSTS